MGSLPDFKINGWNGMNGWMDLHSKLSRTTTNYLRRGGYVFIGVSLFLFICLRDYAQTTQLIFTKFGGMVAHGPKNNLLDFCGKRDHIIR